MNNRQKVGVGSLVSGLVTLAVSLFILTSPETPLWVTDGVKVLSVMLEAFGLVVNLPSNTNPK